MIQQPVVSVEDIVKTFGDIVALDGVSLEFQPGIIYALLGPNGAGKTTLIRVLATLLRPDSGSAVVAGVDVIADPRTARTRIGLAGQSAAVDEVLTGRENVEMIGRLYGFTVVDARRRGSEVLERINLTEAADRMVKTYSGGMRRRLDLAASMVGRPQVLFLDEPTSGIDPANRLDIWDMISDLIDGGTTILLTTQYLDEADQLANRIGVIDNGKLIVEGTADELKDRMGKSVIELVVPGDSRATAIERLEASLSEVATYQEDRDRISIDAPFGPASLMEAVRVLDAASITPTDINLRKPTLDDVFLTLTGHAVTKAEGNGEEPVRRLRTGRSS